MLDPIAPKLRKRCQGSGEGGPPASGIREVFIGELDFAKLTGWEPLEGLKAFAEVRWRDGLNPNLYVGASPNFQPSHFRSGKQWRLMYFGLTCTTPELFGVKEFLTLTGGWIQPQKASTISKPCRKEERSISRTTQPCTKVSTASKSTNGHSFSPACNTSSSPTERAPLRTPGSGFRNWHSVLICLRRSEKPSPGLSLPGSFIAAPDP
jgi:hypothetical protein